MTANAAATVEGLFFFFFFFVSVLLLWEMAMIIVVVKTTATSAVDDAIVVVLAVVAARAVVVVVVVVVGSGGGDASAEMPFSVVVDEIEALRFPVQFYTFNAENHAVHTVKIVLFRWHVVACAFANASLAHIM